jgi:hypothetical protein
MSHSTTCPCPGPLNHTTCRIAIRYNQQEFPSHPSHPPPPHHSIALQPPPPAAPAPAAASAACGVSSQRGATVANGGGGVGAGGKEGSFGCELGGEGRCACWLVGPVSCFKVARKGVTEQKRTKFMHVFCFCVGRGGHHAQRPTERLKGTPLSRHPRRRWDPNRTWFSFTTF